MDKSLNINQDEVEKFSSQADDWWNPQGAFKTLHDINSTRLRFITDNVRLNGLKVLDIGCGGGILTEALANENAQVVGLDASEENIRAAKKHAAENNLDIEYIVSHAEAYAEENKHQFDVICCMELLEHVPQPESIIQACATLLKPGGHVFLSTINRNLKSYLMTVIAGEYLLNLLPRGTHHYKDFIRPSELVNWAKENNLILNSIKGMHYNPLLKQCSLTDKPDANYLINLQRPKND